MNNNPAQYSESKLFKKDNGVTQEIQMKNLQVDSEVKKIDFILVYRENAEHDEKRTRYETNLKNRRLVLQHVPCQDKVCEIFRLL